MTSTMGELDRVAEPLDVDEDDDLRLVDVDTSACTS